MASSSRGVGPTAAGATAAGQPSDEYREWLNSLVTSQQVTALFQSSLKGKASSSLPGPARKRIREAAGDCSEGLALEVKKLRALTKRFAPGSGWPSTWSWTSWQSRPRPLAKLR
ncbi:unnamed protein product [Polarella glacialis]|uniref:Uncharacterized protein n=1 Tax=Polarella glacialis TaxID=89957 RepID=A0A813JTI5_POLGL|nr:unnamed protein product [Polarella glacialis]